MQYDYKVLHTTDYTGVGKLWPALQAASSPVNGLWLAHDGFLNMYSLLPCEWFIYDVYKYFTY